MASTAISSVRGPRRLMRSETLSFLQKDVPSSPLPMSLSQFPYWMIQGSLSPSSASIRSRSASRTVTTWVPYITVRGSPGSTRMARKMSIDTPRRVGTAYISLLMMYEVIGLASRTGSEL